MYSFRGYNNPGRAIKPSLERPAKTEIIKIRNPSLGTLPISRNRKETEPIIENTIKERDKQHKVEIIEEIKPKKATRKIFIKRQRKAPTSEQLRVKVLRKEGYSFSQIAAELNLTRNKVAGICQRFGF